MAAQIEENIFRGIKPGNLVDEYHSRSLDRLSDVQLCQHASAVISHPLENWNSFTLHAPMELLARFGLLPLVDPGRRDLARQQMAATAAAFPEEAGAAPSVKVAAFANPEQAIAEFTRTFHAADANGLEAIVLQFAEQFGISGLVHVLTPLALPALTGAAHSHIGLWLLLRHGRNCDVGDAGLLRAAARALASDPNAHLSSFQGLAMSGDKPLNQSPAEIEREILTKLATAPRGKTEFGSMHHLLSAGEATGNANALFADFIGHDLAGPQIDAAFRAVMRVCAHNMLQHDSTYAKYGWTHCLTLPQSACGLSSFGIDRKRALAAALAWTTAYRSVLSDRDLDLEWSPARLPGSASLIEALQTSPAAAAAYIWHADEGELPGAHRTLATEASIRSDQHLIKYTRACLDMIWFDPHYHRLYLSAAASLCGLWMKEQPETMAAAGLFKR